eukprot:comp20934_c0_seq1/m.27960 comp20934_c0_seq1/g.27960  ORF comp20934_c0_seq1/g.27960 comp20934_c0_seq1/m.27960 type:complete len:158 (-) comp20934_c0_seq1:687-1160(-)
MTLLDEIRLLEINPTKPEDADLYAKERDLRYEILRKPLGGIYSDRKNAKFEFEDVSIHLVAVTPDSRVVGCVLFNPGYNRCGRLYQMAVDPTMRGQGLGTRLVRRLEEVLRERGFNQITLHARQVSVQFYEKLGFHVHGEPFIEVTIPHRHMSKKLV